MEDNHFKVYKNKTRYLPGLDGLRAVAVIAIIIYHLNPSWLPGGYLGVDTFFVISGFLITSLLLKEYEDTGNIDFLSFWKRRIKRLIPAVLFLLSVVITYTLIFERQLLDEIIKDTIAAIFYVSNWWYIFQDVSYFESFIIQPLKHLWSLAIEEQFYVFWPLLLLFLLKSFKKMKNIAIITIIITIISLIIMMIVANVGADNSRAYFGTDSRLQTLLIGVMLAYFWKPFRLKENLDSFSKKILNTAGMITLSLLLLMFIVVNSSSDWIYFGGLFLISLFTTIIIAVSTVPNTFFSKVLLGNGVMTYIGSRSYSLYLWHFPIISFLNNRFVKGQIPIYIVLLELILTFALAEVSYRFVEQPFRKNGWRTLTDHLKTSYLVKVRTVSIVLLFSTMLVALTGIFNKIDLEDENVDRTLSFNSGSKTMVSAEVSGLSLRHKQPLIIGDSVTLDYEPFLKEIIPRAIIDGEVSRQFYEMVALLQTEYANYHSDDDIVVIQFGTNGDVTEKSIMDVVNLVSPANLYLINTRVPREWEGNVNRSMQNVAEQVDNVYLIDWHAASEGHTEYFVNDGVHLTYEGSEAMTQLIIDSLQSRIEN